MTKNTGRPTKNAGRRKSTRIIGQRTNTVGHRRQPAGYSVTALDALFGGRALGRLLRLFFLNPSRDFYQRELSAMTGERLFLIQSALKRLSAAAVIDANRRGNRIYFRANRSHPAFPELKSLILKTFGLGDQLLEALRPLASRIWGAFVYGSAARGDETETSDVDIMVIGDITSKDVATALAPTKLTLGREMNVSIYRPNDLRSRVRTKHPFIREVLRSPKIFLVGNDDQIRTVLTRR